MAARGLGFQQCIWQLQARQFRKAKRLASPVVFFDRGIPDSFAYLKLTHDVPPRELTELAARLRYDAVFILDPLPFYEKDRLRTESKDEAQQIQNWIYEAYEHCGYAPMQVPFDTLESRAGFILSRLATGGPGCQPT